MSRFGKYGLVAVLAVACSSEDPTYALDPAAVPPAGQSVAIDATVEFVALEGGCWALKTSDGYFEPIGLPTALRNNGERVRVWISRTNNIVSACQIAPIVQVDSARSAP